MAALRTDRRRSSLSPGDGGQRGGPTRGSVCFTGVDSLEVFIFFWGWKVFDGVKRVFGFKVIQECSDSGNGVPVPIPHWRWGRGGPSRRPGGWWGWLPTAGGLSRTMQSVGGWGRGGVTPPISQHGWWGRRGCTTAGGVPGWRRGAAALEGRGGRGRRRRRETPQGARRLPVQGVVSLRQLRGRLGDGAGRAVGDAGGLPVRGRWGGEGLALSPRPRSDTDWGGRGLDRWRGGGSIPAGRRSLSRGGRQGLLPVVGGDLGAVRRRGGGRRGGTAARWGRRRGGRAVLHAGATSGAGPGEVRQGWPLCARQLRRRGSAVVRIILRSAVAGRHRGPGGSGSGAGDLQGLLPRAV